MRTRNLLVAVVAGTAVVLASGCATRSLNVSEGQPAAGSDLHSVISNAPPAQPESATLAQPGLLGRVKPLLDIPAAPFAGEGWRPLFNGENLSGWEEAGFGGGGELEAGSGVLVMNMGEPFTGIRYTNDFPTNNYEVAMDAMRVMGSDFFCALSVPVGESFCSLIVGGWGGSLVGISSLNGMDASENETTRFMTFEKNQWYRVRLRVTTNRLEAWIDKQKVVDVVTSGKYVSLRPGEIEECKPMGLATWQTAAAFREIRFRYVEEPADPPPKSLY